MLRAIGIWFSCWGVGCCTSYTCRTDNPEWAVATALFVIAIALFGYEEQA